MNWCVGGTSPDRRCGWLALFLLSAVSASAPAQELEPRLLSNLPEGMQFLVIGYGYSRGNILLDPAVPIEDLDARLHTAFIGYLRSVALFDTSCKIDVAVPTAHGEWKGRLEGEAAATHRNGFGDPRVRLSVNLAGAPVLDEPEGIGGYRQELIIGASLQVIAPLGQYDSSRLINLGSNRWTFRTTVGASRRAGSWLLEGYLGIWLFTRNGEFFTDNTLTQKPLFTAKIHAIRTMRQGRWIALDFGYGVGGRTRVNGDERDTHLSTLRLGATVAWPVAERHTLKLILVSGVRLEKGPDFDAVNLAYQYRWGGLP